MIFQEGTLVQGILGWQDYEITDGAGLTPLPKDPNIPLAAHFGLFGHIGVTAYFGLLDVENPNLVKRLLFQQQPVRLDLSWVRSEK